MATAFIAVVRTGSSTERPALLAAGATAVLSWAELATSGEPDDVPVVLVDELDLGQADLGAADLGAAGLDAADLGDSGLGRADSGRADLGQAELAALLNTLIAVDPLGGSAGRSVRSDRDVVIATVRPVVDTLKLVDAEGLLIGTADREDHRFVGTPIAARLRVLRAVSRDLERPDLAPPHPVPSDPALSGPPSSGPSAVAVLAALVRRGATVLGSSH